MWGTSSCLVLRLAWGWHGREGQHCDMGADASPGLLNASQLFWPRLCSEQLPPFLRGGTENLCLFIGLLRNIARDRGEWYMNWPPSAIVFASLSSLLYHVQKERRRIYGSPSFWVIGTFWAPGPRLQYIASHPLQLHHFPDTPRWGLWAAFLARRRPEVNWNAMLGRDLACCNSVCSPSADGTATIHSPEKGNLLPFNLA